MSDYQTLKKRLAATPILVADLETGEIELVAKPPVENAPFPTRVVLNLAGALEGFARLRGVGTDDREFGIGDVAKVAGMSYNLTYHYIKKEVFVPSIRAASGSGRGDVEARFSWRDAFIAATIGCLRRHGIAMEHLSKVHDIFDGQVKKQTARN